jgi:hypothetical protein
MVEVVVTEVGVVELEDGVVEAGVVAIVAVEELTSAVVSMGVTTEDLQAEVIEIDAKAAPPAAMPTRFRNCLLENFVMRKLALFSGKSFFSSSDIFSLLGNRAGGRGHLRCSYPNPNPWLNTSPLVKSRTKFPF